VINDLLHFILIFMIPKGM